jgi:5-methylcytosine-specific restriction endonuclease McrA
MPRQPAGAVPRSPGRTGHAWRRLCAQVYAEESVCWLCGNTVDMSAAPRTPQSRSVDHVIPLTRGGDPLDRANLRLAHYGCNARKGNRPARRRRTSRQW